MFTSTKISELQARIGELETQLSTEQGEKATLQTQLDQAKIDLATAQTEANKVASLTARLEDQEKLSIKLTGERDAAQAALATAKADFDTKVNAEVTTRLAAAGVDPIKRDPTAKTESQTITRAEFNALSPHARAQHCRNGGKITD